MKEWEDKPTSNVVFWTIFWAISIILGLMRTAV